MNSALFLIPKEVSYKASGISTQKTAGEKNSKCCEETTAAFF